MVRMAANEVYVISSDAVQDGACKDMEADFDKDSALKTLRTKVMRKEKPIPKALIAWKASMSGRKRPRNE